jgi:peptide chain release factor subunit 1
VADALTWETLRDLAGFRAAKGCALSVYLSLDPSEVPTLADAQTRMNSVLDDAHRQLLERRSSLGHAEREALKGDLERLRSWFEFEFDRDGARGVAVFAAGLDNLWQEVRLSEPVSDCARLDRELFLTPLVPLVGRYEGAIVGYVGRERAELYTLRNGRLVEIADQTEQVPGQHDKGGWSQARYERHIETIVARHLTDVGRTLDAAARRTRGVPIVLIGPSDEVRSEFEELLAHETRARIIGWTTAEAHAEAPQLLEVALPLLGDWGARRDADLLDRWREEAGRNGRAVAGWDATLEAASDGRVELLLVQGGVDREAFRCPACGRAQSTDGACPLDGTTMEPSTAGLDLAIHQTLTHGGTVRVIEDRRDLEPVGGVAALLRF